MAAQLTTFIVNATIRSVDIYTEMSFSLCMLQAI